MTTRLLALIPLEWIPRRFRTRFANWRVHRARMADRNPCCRVDANLVAEATGQEHLYMKRCRVCRCRHFVGVAHPGRFVSVGSAIGAS